MEAIVTIGYFRYWRDIIFKFLEEEVDKELLNQAISKLSGREKTIVELRFGLKNGKERTQKEVADILGISQSYISRLEKRIIKRLKKEMIRLMWQKIIFCHF